MDDASKDAAKLKFVQELLHKARGESSSPDFKMQQRLLGYVLAYVRNNRYTDRELARFSRKLIELVQRSTHHAQDDQYSASQTLLTDIVEKIRSSKLITEGERRRLKAFLTRTSDHYQKKRKVLRRQAKRHHTPLEDRVADRECSPQFIKYAESIIEKDRINNMTIKQLVKSAIKERKRWVKCAELESPSQCQAEGDSSDRLEQSPWMSDSHHLCMGSNLLDALKDALDDSKSDKAQLLIQGTKELQRRLTKYFVHKQKLLREEEECSLQACAQKAILSCGEDKDTLQSHNSDSSADAGITAVFGFQFERDGDVLYSISPANSSISPVTVRHVDVKLDNIEDPDDARVVIEVGLRTGGLYREIPKEMIATDDNTMMLPEDVVYYTWLPKRQVEMDCANSDAQQQRVHEDSLPLAHVLSLDFKPLGQSEMQKISRVALILPAQSRDRGQSTTGLRMLQEAGENRFIVDLNSPGKSAIPSVGTH